MLGVAFGVCNATKICVAEAECYHQRENEWFGAGFAGHDSFPYP